MPNPLRRRFLQASVGATAAALAGPLAHGAAEDLPGKTPHTRFAVNIEMWWRDRPFLERIRLAASLGFPAVEFWPWQGKDLDAVAGLMEELGIELAQFTAWGFEPGLNDPANHKDFVEAVRKGCEVAKRLRCTKMTVVGGNDQPGMTQAEMHDHIIQGLKLAAPIAEEQEVMLILEPMNIRVDHKGHCLYGSEPAVRICREVGSSHVKINWDLYHMQISEGDLCGHLADGFDQLGYVQIADHPGRHEPGTGEINFVNIAAALRRLGYDGEIGLEFSPSKDPASALTVVQQLFPVN